MKYIVSPATAGLFDHYLSLVDLQRSLEASVIASGVGITEVDEKMERFNNLVFSALDEILTFVGDSIRQNINTIQEDTIQV